MSDLQQGRGVAKKMFKRPKNFVKAQKDANEVFNADKTTAADTAKWRPVYSRVTHKLVSKN